MKNLSKLFTIVMVAGLSMLLTGCTDVNDNPTPAKYVEIDLSDISLEAGKSQAINLIYVDPSVKLECVSDNPDVVTVDDNLVLTAVGEGETLVTVNVKVLNGNAEVIKNEFYSIKVVVTSSSMEISDEPISQFDAD